jgi:hypothetical protein
MHFVSEGQQDSSQVRSAWVAIQKCVFSGDMVRPPAAVASERRPLEFGHLEEDFSCVP